MKELFDIYEAMPTVTGYNTIVYYISDNKMLDLENYIIQRLKRKLVWISSSDRYFVNIITRSTPIFEYEGTGYTRIEALSKALIELHRTLTDLERKEIRCILVN